MNLLELLEELATELSETPAPEAVEQLKELIPEFRELCRHRWLLRLLLQICE